MNARLTSEMMKLAHENFPIVISSLNELSDEAYKPLEKIFTQLGLSLDNVSEADPLLIKIRGEVDQLNLMIQSEEKEAGVLSDILVVIAKDFDVLKRLMKDRKEKQLDVIPDFTLRGMPEKLMVVEALINYYVPAKTDDERTVRELKVLRELLLLRAKSIVQCDEMRTHLNETLPAQAKEYDQLRKDLKQAQSIIVSRLNANIAANSKTHSPSTSISDSRTPTPPPYYGSTDINPSAPPLVIQPNYGSTNAQPSAPSLNIPNYGLSTNSYPSAPPLASLAAAHGVFRPQQEQRQPEGIKPKAESTCCLVM